MAISIITAAVRGELLDRVLASIEKQTYKDWEWIIVNDDSNSVRFWLKNKVLPNNAWVIDIGRNQGDYGLQARNVGIMCSNHSRIVFLDDDNEWETEKYLENLVRTERKTGRTPFTNLRIRGKKPGSTHDVIKRTMFLSNKIDLGNILYKKEFFLKYGYFDNSKNRITFDWDFIRNLVEKEGEDSFVKVEENLVFWHHRY